MGKASLVQSSTDNRLGFTSREITCGNQVVTWPTRACLELFFDLFNLSHIEDSPILFIYQFIWKWEDFYPGNSLCLAHWILNSFGMFAQLKLHLRRLRYIGPSYRTICTMNLQNKLCLSTEQFQRKFTLRFQQKIDQISNISTDSLTAIM